MILFGPVFRWLFPFTQTFVLTNGKRSLVQILRWQHAGGRMPDLTHMEIVEADRLTRIADQAVRLAPLMYDTWRTIYGIKARWHELTKREQLLWYERAGRCLLELPKVGFH